MIIDPRNALELSNLQETEYKSSPQSPQMSFTEFLWSRGHEDLSAWMAIQLYEKAMPLFNAVDMRATAFSQIPVRLWNKRKEEYVDSHPALDLLAMPNADMSTVEFLEQVSSFFDITGETFIAATGNIAKDPLELITVPPQFTIFSSQGSFGLLSVPENIQVNLINNRNGNIVFKANENTKYGLRFISRSEDKEIWHIRSFNPNRCGGNFRGMSRARPLWLELEQYISGNTTNLSMLKRGTRMSLAWVNNRGEELTDKQYERMQAEAAKYSGDANAGGTPILDGMDVKAIQQSNKDMEFKDLQEAMFERTSITYGIPLPLLINSAMTLNNLETSMLQFFDRAVLPLTNRLYGELSRFILPRYKDGEDLEFRYNEVDITALKARMIETAKRQSEVGVNTDNELREVLGYDELPEGGDQVWKRMGMVPVGEMGDQDPATEEAKTIFQAKLSEAGYNELEIKQMTKDHFSKD